VNTVHYLIDSNVLSRLTAEQRRSDFLREHCRIPSEVLYEVQTFPDIGQLRALEYPVSSALLWHVREVMETEVPGNFKLVNLYRNKGNADPILIATALTAMRKASGTLFGEDWKVVTDDVAVRDKATAMGVGWLSTEDLVAKIAQT